MGQNVAGNVGESMPTRHVSGSAVNCWLMSLGVVACSGGMLPQRSILCGFEWCEVLDRY